MNEMSTLQQGVAAALSARYAVSIAAQSVVITHDQSVAIRAAIRGSLQPGDRVLIPDPCDPLYVDAVLEAGAAAVRIASRFDGSLDLRALENSAAESRMTVLCNPGNPTGRVHGPDELAGLTSILKKNPELLLFADETQANLVYDGAIFQSALQLPTVRHQVIHLGGFPAAYDMAVGPCHIVAPPMHVSAISLMNRSVGHPISDADEATAHAALQLTPEDLRALTASYERRRDVVDNILGFTPGIVLRRPQASIYAYLRITVDLSMDDLLWHLAGTGLAVRSGTDFGRSGEGHVRLSFATDMVSLIDGLHKLVDVIR